MVWIKQIVRVEKIDVLAARAGGPIITRRATLTVLLLKIFDARVCNTPDGVLSLVEAAIVNHDHFKSRFLLGQNRFNCLTNQCCSVVSRDYDREVGSVVHGLQTLVALPQ